LLQTESDAADTFIRKMMIPVLPVLPGGVEDEAEAVGPGGVEDEAVRPGVVEDEVVGSTANVSADASFAKEANIQDMVPIVRLLCSGLDTGRG
jgi:hypothetical protein